MLIIRTVAPSFMICSNRPANSSDPCGSSGMALSPLGIWHGRTISCWDTTNDRAILSRMTSTETETQRRADGERTHALILEAATKLASIEGVHGITIGRLAEETGISKSGLYAHFGSKEQLQLEVIQAAGAVVEREVF